MLEHTKRGIISHVDIIEKVNLGMDKNPKKL